MRAGAQRKEGGCWVSLWDVRSLDSSGDKGLGHLGASRMLMAPWASPEGQRGQRTSPVEMYLDTELSCER